MKKNTIPPPPPTGLLLPQVDWVRRRLLENSKIARATHNIAAWRIWDEVRGVQLHDNDDDGKRGWTALCLEYSCCLNDFFFLCYTHGCALCYTNYVM